MSARKIAITITIDNKDAINAAKAQVIALKGLGDETRRNTQLQNGLTSSFLKGNLAARAISAAYLAVRDSLYFAIGGAIQFEQNIARIAAVTGQSDRQMKSLTTTINQMSRAVAVPINDIATTALELSKLGFEGEQLQTALRGVAQLSQVLGDSLQATGELVGSVIHTFGLAGDEASQVADKLFVATGKSASNVEGFKVAFSLAGGAAEAAGVSFEQFSAAVAALSNQGVRASTIGTGLRTIFTELARSGSDAERALGGGIGDFGLNGAIDRLTVLKPEIGSIVDLFSKPAVPVVLGLIKARDAYGGFVNDITNSGPALEAGGVIINGSLTSQVVLLKNAFVELFEAINFTPLKSFADALTTILHKATDDAKKETAFQSFYKETQSKGQRLTTALGLPEDKQGGGFYSDDELREAFRVRQLLSNRNKERQGDFSDPRDEQASLRAAMGKVSLVPPIDPNLKVPGIKPKNKKNNKEAEKDSPDFDPMDVFDRLQDIESNGNTYQENFEANRRKKETKVDKTDTHLKATADSIIANRDQNSPNGVKPEDKIKQFEAEQAEYRRIYATNLEVMSSLDKQRDDYKRGLKKAELDREMAFGASLVSSSLTIFGALALNEKKERKERKALAMAEIMINTAVAVSKVWGQTGIFGIGAQWAPIAAGAAQLAVVSQQKFATGGDQVFRQPTMMMVGESGAERVRVTPRGKMSSDDGAKAPTIIIQGDVYDYDKFQRKVKMAQDSHRRSFV